MTDLPAYLREYHAALRALQRDVSADRYLAATGRQAAANPALYDRYPHLTDGRLLRTALEHGDTAYAIELAMLHLRVALRGATDRLRRAQIETTAQVAGRSQTHSQLLAAARDTHDPAEQAVLREAIAAVVVRLGEVRRQWLGEWTAAVTALGFDGGGAFLRALHPQLDAWSAHAATWLDDTRTAFLDRWENWRGTDQPQLRDLLAAGPAARLPEHADGHRAVLDTMTGWGFTDQLQGVSVDLEPRPGKIAMSFCSPVDPPTDIRLSASAPRLLSDTVTLLHEYMHAAHYATLDGITASWRIGAAAMEATGLALEPVALSPAWARRMLGWRPPDDVLDRLRFRRDAVRRLVTVCLLFEVDYHDGLSDPEARYAQLLHREMGVTCGPGDAWTRLQSYLEAQPCYPLVYAQAYLGAEHLGNQLSGGDDNWHQRPDAGQRIRSMLACAGSGIVAVPGLSAGHVHG